MQICQSCETGQLHREYVPYIQIVNGQMMIVPDVPALVCDCCQVTIHDNEFLNQFDELLTQSIVNQVRPRPEPTKNEQTLLTDFLAYSSFNT